jgi:signal peptidase I
VSDERRPVLARIGIAALNLIWPGLGLLRLGRGKAAAAAIFTAAAGFALLIACFAVVPQLGPIGYFGALGLLVILYAGALLASIWRSWKGSRWRQENRPWWSRWYAVLALALCFWGLPQLLRPWEGYYKPFYLPSEAMAPTLIVNDRLIASMEGAKSLRRGDIILFRVGAVTYIKRLAALPGDRIEMRGGIVVLNGAPVPQTFIREESVASRIPGRRARRLREQLPGEARPHEIYDAGWTPFDDMPEQRIPAGHVFVLGDHRDMSADSRVPRAEQGVELLPVRDIQGRALFHSWGSSGEIGQPLGR